MEQADCQRRQNECIEREKAKLASCEKKAQAQCNCPDGNCTMGQLKCVWNKCGIAGKIMTCPDCDDRSAACDSEHDSCYQGCGGTVRQERQCVANCEGVPAPPPAAPATPAVVPATPTPPAAAQAPAQPARPAFPVMPPGVSLQPTGQWPKEGEAVLFLFHNDATAQGLLSQYRPDGIVLNVGGHVQLVPHAAVKAIYKVVARP